MASYLTDTDHGGADWSINAGDYIAGNHYNINKFSINGPGTVYIETYNGTLYGSAIIDALFADVPSDIIFQGTGRGYGAGGGGGAGNGYGGGTNGIGQTGSIADNARGGDGGGLTLKGLGGHQGTHGWEAASGDTGIVGGDASNETPDDNLDVLMGAAGGGGGAGGEHFEGFPYPGNYVASGGGGGAGYSGGASLKIYASLIKVDGQIVSNDEPHGFAQQGVGAPSVAVGGHANVSGTSVGGLASPGTPHGGAGGNGGRGAGGRIVLEHKRSFITVTAYPKVYVTGTIDNQGGAAGNGGSLKVASPSYSALGTILTRTEGVRRVTVAPLGVCL